MANGQVVLVTTEGLSGGSPMRAVYYVAEEDPTKAQAIIDYRNENGRFNSIEDIQKVKGIKEGEFSKIKDQIRVR